MDTGLERVISQLFYPSLFFFSFCIPVSPPSSSSYVTLEFQRRMDMNSSNQDGGDDNDVVDVNLWCGGTISDWSGNEPRYNGGLNMFQKV